MNEILIMDRMLFVLSIVTKSVLLTMFYSAFLVPKSVKIHRSVVYAGFGFAYLLLQAALFYLYVLIDLSEYGSMRALVSSFFAPVISIISLYILSLVFFKRSLALQIFLSCSFIAVMEIGYYAASSIDIGHYIIYTIKPLNNFFPLQIALDVMLYSVLCFLSLRSIVKSLSPLLARRSNANRYWEQVFNATGNHKISAALFEQAAKPLCSLSELLYLILPCLSGLALACIMKVLPYKIDFSGNWEITAAIPFYEILIPLAGIIFLFSLTASAKLFKKMTELRINEGERMALQKQMQQIREQVRDVNAVYSDIRSMRHDIKGHISNLRLLVKSLTEGKQDAHEEFEKYYGALSATLIKLDYVFQTENPITDVIIHQKYHEAVNRKIDFSADFIFPAGFNVDAYDIAVILNNSLENAIEANDFSSEDRRYIRLYSYIKGEMFFIEVENRFGREIIIDKHSGLPLSIKQDNFAHGIGLSNIQRCARKYHGDIDVQISKEDGVFLLTVMLLKVR